MSLDKKELEMALNLQCARGVKPSHLKYTYIAKSQDGDIYKIGMSRNPLRRYFAAESGYSALNLKMRYFLEGDIELPLICALVQAGAKRFRQEGAPHKNLEAFFLDEKDIQQIVKRFGFRPIEEFDAVAFTELAKQEREQFSEGNPHKTVGLSLKNLQDMVIGETVVWHLEDGKAIIIARRIIHYAKRHHNIKCVSKADYSKRTLTITRIS